MRPDFVRRLSSRLPLILLLFSAASLCFLYGLAVGKYKVFPYKVMSLALLGAQDLLGWNDIFLLPAPQGQPAIVHRAGAFDGLNLAVEVADHRLLRAKIMDMDGRNLHVWSIDWFKIWPDARHVPEDRAPRRRPGTLVHGAVVLKNGDLVFNFEWLGLVRLDRDGNVVWRLPYQTHHSVVQDENEHLWVCGNKRYEQPDPRFPNRIPPFDENTILQLTPQGKILREWSVSEILTANGYQGLLHIRTISDSWMQTTGDMLHLNSVEPFAAGLKEGFFGRGDLLVSLRNINTVFVFNRDTGKIKFLCTGWFIWQHDPHFINGNTFTVFDNNCVTPGSGGSSRIVAVDAPTRERRILFEGNPQAPFFTPLMGKHQWLPNGNLLITEAWTGRAFELNAQHEVVWRYVNYVGEGTAGLVTQVERLPLSYAGLFERTDRPSAAATEPQTGPTPGLTP